ncbi:Holliday junction resolvase RuvX [Iocasia frigidifontis]|uniref:Putative pre-16S rRNA nuclease n=1 Tax=Iocasia fonsfrigidae TaxID=2682810 RepID=A0A8A7KI89_9FIRM|nr:Holliday junction resolvase RuvX [Iocasia fonsfrigidae]QTL98567.1 Holliday junction resolvase RuvX [Iocasia fonsfrigidae]
MRIMGLDYGDKTIGVAISDVLGLTAQSKGVIRRKNLTEDFIKLQDYLEEYQITEIVVGFPINMNGTLGPRVEKTNQFVNFLRKRVDIPVNLWDERLTTVAAERVLLEADLSRSKRKDVIDAVAAALILQGYLDLKNRKKNKEKRGKSI